jgi:hypothetical protein
VNFNATKVPETGHVEEQMDGIDVRDRGSEPSPVMLFLHKLCKERTIRKGNKKEKNELYCDS